MVTVIITLLAAGMFRSPFFCCAQVEHIIDSIYPIATLGALSYCQDCCNAARSWFQGAFGHIPMSSPGATAEPMHTQIEKWVVETELFIGVFMLNQKDELLVGTQI